MSVSGLRFTIPNGRHADEKKIQRELAESIRGSTHWAGDLADGMVGILGCVLRFMYRLLSDLSSRLASGPDNSMVARYSGRPHLTTQR